MLTAHRLPCQLCSPGEYPSILLARRRQEYLRQLTWVGSDALDQPDVYVLFEHKSDVEARINLDLLRYRVRIGEQWLNDGNMGLLPVIIPVVFYHGAARWGVQRQFAETVAEAPGLQRYVPVCEYHLQNFR